MQYKPLRRRTIEAKVQRDRGAEGPKVKPDPNNVYFVDEITGGVMPEGVHPVRGGGLPRRGARRGTSTRSRSWTWSATLHVGKYHDVDSSQDAFKLAADGERSATPRQAGRHHAAGADHEGGGGRARSSTRGRSPATSTAAAAMIEETSEDKGSRR